MRKLILPIVIAAFFFTACQSEKTNQNEANKVSVETNIVEVSDTFCYSYIKNRDTAKLTFIITNGIITGELSYNLYEKDSNKGIIEGEMHGDTLKVDFTFNSEGKESVRQVAFLKKDNKLMEGFGEVEEKNGKTLFKATSNLNFTDGMIFSKIDCSVKGY